MISRILAWRHHNLSSAQRHTNGHEVEGGGGEGLGVGPAQAIDSAVPVVPKACPESIEGFNRFAQLKSFKETKTSNLQIGNS
jgi:hypothetical protein